MKAEELSKLSSYQTLTTVKYHWITNPQRSLSESWRAWAPIAVILLTEASIPIICRRAFCQSEMSFLLGGNDLNQTKICAFWRQPSNLPPSFGLILFSWILNTGVYVIQFSVVVAFVVFHYPRLQFIANQSNLDNKAKQTYRKSKMHVAPKKHWITT